MTRTPARRAPVECAHRSAAASIPAHSSTGHGSPEGPAGRTGPSTGRPTVGPQDAADPQDAAALAAAAGPARRGGRLPALDWRLRFGALALVWGFSFLFIKVGNEAFAPLYVTLGRMLFGSAVLTGALVARRERPPRRPATLGHLAVAAFFLNALPFSLFAYAETTIPSTLAGICNAASPLWAMLLAVVTVSDDRPTRRRVGGLGVGFVGVLIVLGVWQGFAGENPLGTSLALVASLSYAVGWQYVRRTLSASGHSHLAMSGTQLLIGTLEVAVAALLFAPAPHSLAVAPLLSVVALGALGTGLAFLVQYGLVAEVGATIAMMVTYFVPVIATVAGVTILGERPGWNAPVGAVVVLVGAALTQGRPGGGTSAGRVGRPSR